MTGSGVESAAATSPLALVDDDDKVRAVLRLVAEPLAWQVFEFRNGQELFAALSGGLRPELIMLDMVMPEMDGIETIAALGAISVRCPVVLMTGRRPLYTRTADELGRAHGLEIRQILHKPVPLAELRRVLARAPGPPDGSEAAERLENQRPEPER